MGNRIRNIINCLAWFDKKDIKVLWAVNNWCGAMFEDIFCVEAFNFANTQFKDVKKQILDKKIFLFSHDNQFGCSVGNFSDIRQLNSPKNEVEKKIFSSGQQAMIYTSEIHPSLSLQKILSSCKKLNLNPKIKAKAKNISRFHGFRQGSYFGLHVRLTDSGYQPDHYRKYFISPTLTKKKTLICTDDYAKAFDLAGGRPGFIIRRSKAEPKKYHKERDWRETTEYRDGRVFGFNVRRSRAAILDAVTDLILLADSEIIPTKPSSFSEVAGYLGYEHQSFRTKAFLLKRRIIQKIKLFLFKIKIKK